MLTCNALKQFLEYRPEVGHFVWITCRNSNMIGKQAGYLNNNGMVCIELNGKQYLAHRLAWLYMTGSWPKDQIDHINRIRCDNRWENLREAYGFENCQNVGLRKNNKSGYIGVDWHKVSNCWRARVMFQGKSHIVGYFSTEVEAAVARQLKKEELHKFNPVII